MNREMVRKIMAGVVAGALLIYGFRSAVSLSASNRIDVPALRHPAQWTLAPSSDSPTGRIDLPITNTGNRRLIVHWTLEDCCQRLASDQAVTIPAGATRRLQVDIDLAEVSPDGPIEMRLFSNDPQLPQSTISILVPQDLVPGDVEADEMLPIPETH